LEENDAQGSTEYSWFSYNLSARRKFGGGGWGKVLSKPNLLEELHASKN
jgi:hypothetical protein